MLMTLPPIVLWELDCEDHAVVPGQLISHRGTGSRYTLWGFTAHLIPQGIVPLMAMPTMMR